MSDSNLFDEPLLTTKFFLPVSSHAVIPRAHLFTLLDKGLVRPLILVSAPAGFGKSTLVSAWVQSKPPGDLLIAWVSLDQGDNDQRRFWAYVLTALERCRPGAYQPFFSLLQEQQFFVSSLLTALLNALERQSETQLLVLDDYHVITEPAIHSAFASFIERLPPQVHIILITRADPPIKLSRLRGRDQVLEVRTDHLRWNPEEAQAFLETAMGMHLESQEIEQVTVRTEGWVMGLQLFALSLRGYATPQPLLAQMSGKERYILDYLTEEVLLQQPAAIQRFLLQTAILTWLTASLCDRVTQQTESQYILERLERENVFLMALDRERCCYRYHTLFAEALRARLGRVEEQQALSALHRRASDWYAEHGHLKEAVEHAIQAQDWSRTLDLMESAIQMLPQGRQGSPSLLPWLSQVPARAVRQRPRLCLFFARILLLSARFQEALSWLDAAEAQIAAGSTGQHEGSLEADRHSRMPDLERMVQLSGLLGYRAQIASYYGDSRAAYAYSQQALSYLSEQDLYERANVACALTLAALAEGEVRNAIQHASVASRLMQDANVTQAAICFRSISAFLLHRQGQLHAAWKIYQDAITLGTGPENVPFTAVGLAYAYQADLLREWNQLDEARDYALRGLRLAEQGGYMTVYLGRAYQALVRIYLSRGELDAARRTLKELFQLPLLAHNPYQQALLTSVEQVRLWISLGEEEQARRWASEQRHREGSLAPLAAERVEVALARVCLLQGQAAEALTRLERVITQATAQQRWQQVLEARILQALAQQANRQMEKALVTLAEAVRLAEPEGYLRLFVDEGPCMQTMLASLRAQEQHQGSTPYLDQLLAAFASTPLPAEGLRPATTHQRRASQPSSPVPDPLSTREQEVLHLLAQGASNQEIAAALVVTVDTVKYHVSNILLKLQARNRTQAVARARSLGLLSGEA